MGRTFSCKGNVMTESMVDDVVDVSGDKVAEFGTDRLRVNAALYQTHKRLIDAVSAAKYDTPADAVKAIGEVVEALMSQIADGGRFTPDRGLGFGSDNASEIAKKILGLGTSDATTRKQFAALGK
jgi:hypothetical protein